MRFKQYLTPVALTVAVLFSIGLSVILWTNPSNYHSKQNTNSNTQNASNEVENKSKNYIFTPVQVLYNENGNQADLLSNKGVNVVAEVKHQLKKYKYNGVKEISSNSSDKYFEIAKTPKSFLLSYPDNIPMSLVDNLIRSSNRSMANDEINRIVIPTDDDSKLYLLGDRNYKVYEVSVDKHDQKPLTDILETSLQKIPASFAKIGNQPSVFVDGDIQLQSYKYLLNSQSESFYVSRLLNDEDTEDVSIKHRQDTNIYSDNKYRQLTFNTKTNDVSYSDYQENDLKADEDSILSASYDELVKLGYPLENVRFFNYDNKTNTVSYRLFVEGYPVFNRSGKSAISMQLITKTAKKYQFSLDNPQIPLPSNDGQISLPSTSKVIDTLKKLGYEENHMEQIKLGYTWKNDKSSKLVINLIPDWYILYHGRWYSFTEMTDR